jgi:hypothetical protein
VEQPKKQYEEELSRRKNDYEEILKRRYDEELPKRRLEDRNYQELIENSRKKEESRKIQEESRKIEEQSRKKYYEDSLKSRYERELELEKLRAREDIFDRVSHIKSPEYEKELERTRYEIQERRSRMAAEDSMGSFR